MKRLINSLRTQYTLYCIDQDNVHTQTVIRVRNNATAQKHKNTYILTTSRLTQSRNETITTTITQTS